MRNHGVFPMVVCVILSGFPAGAQKGPQDNWVIEPNTIGGFNQPWGLALDTNCFYVADTLNYRVRVISKNGEFVRQWGNFGDGNMQFRFVCGIAVDDQFIYTADRDQNKVKKFTKGGEFVISWGGIGSGNGQFFNPMGITVDEAQVYVADKMNHRISVFDKNGIFIRSWGTYGSANAQFNQPIGVAVDAQSVYVVEVFNGGRIQVFTKQGQWMRSWTQPNGGSTNGNAINVMNINVDTHNVYVASGVRVSATATPISHILIYDKQGALHTQLTSTSNFKYPGGIATDNPFVYVADQGLNQISTVRRIFRTLGEPVVNPIPLSEITEISQRPGSAIVDIKYRCMDENDPVLHIYPAAFVATNSMPRLTELIPMRSLVEGTSGNTGTLVSTGAVHCLSWDMEADNVAGRVGDVADLKFAILASDGRPPIDLHFLSLPAVGTRPAGVINRSPLLDSDFLPFWFWLVAANDPGIEFHDGRVYQAATARSILFAEGVSTTAAGREFLFAKMNVRAATVEEYTHAREATTPGMVTMRDPRRQPPPSGYKVNEFNFVTSPTNGFWVVPLTP